MGGKVIGTSFCLPMVLGSSSVKPMNGPLESLALPMGGKLLVCVCLPMGGKLSFLSFCCKIGGGRLDLLVGPT